MRRCILCAYSDRLEEGSSKRKISFGYAPSCEYMGQQVRTEALHRTNTSVTHLMEGRYLADRILDHYTTPGLGMAACLLFFVALE